MIYPFFGAMLVVNKRALFEFLTGSRTALIGVRQITKIAMTMLCRSCRSPQAVIGGILIAVFIFSGGVSLAQVAEPPSEKSKANTGAGQHGAVSAPKPQTSHLVGQQEERNGDYYAKAELDTQQRMAVATERLAELTDTQIKITGIEATLLTITIFFTAWAAIAASNAAKAAKVAVDIAQNTAKLELRPYVGICNAHMNEILVDAYATAVITIENVGKTPAFDTTAWHALFSPEDNFDWNAPPKPTNLKRFTTLPAGKFILNISSKSPLDQMCCDAILRQDLDLYVWGRIEYRDVFGDDHCTTFRYRVSHTLGGVSILNKCEEGNEAT